MTPDATTTEPSNEKDCRNQDDVSRARFARRRANVDRPTTDFRAFAEYCCRHCGKNCINRINEVPTKLGECKQCHSIPDLELDYAVDDVQDDVDDDRPAGLVEDVDDDRPDGGAA